MYSWYSYYFLLYVLDFQLSYHKFNESLREQAILKRLKEGDIVALITDAGTPGISDPGTELVRTFKFCIHCIFSTLYLVMCDN